jgi:hypothetical protein
MPRCYEAAHIAGVSKAAYAPATPRCLQWRRDPHQASANSPSSPPRRSWDPATERDALMAILLPSANHVAVLVARPVSGSVRPGLATPAATYRRHIENRIRPGNTPLS